MTSTEVRDELHECWFCLKLFIWVNKDIHFIPDPLRSEIYNDQTPHWICNRCVMDRRAEI